MAPSIEQTGLIAPYGGELVDLVAPPERFAELKARAGRLDSIQLSERAVCDLELLATGAFSPLDRFMGEDDYRRSVGEMRLGDGTLFPVPVTLSIDDASSVKIDADLALRDARNDLLAVMTIQEAYEWSPLELADEVFGTRDARHPIVSEMQRWGRVNVSGPLQVLQLPRRYDFTELRRTPQATRAELAAHGRANVVAFHAYDPFRRAEEELTRRAAESVDGVLLLHPAVGSSKPGDMDHYTRIRTYRTLSLHYYEDDRVLLSLLPLATRFAGPREALWHAIIRRNYGANFLIVGRDHASPPVDSVSRPFYRPDDARELVDRYSAETGVRAVTFRETEDDTDGEGRTEVAAVPEGAHGASPVPTQLGEGSSRQGQALPNWIAMPEVASILAERHPPKHRQGVCIWFTGLSGSGKSTTAELLAGVLMEHGRRVTVLDGDVVRTHLSKGLGFSKDDRDANIRRIGFVASEMVRHGGVAICAAVSPYSAVRNEVRAMVGSERFVEVFVDTPLHVCEDRDPKGMYARARRGEISNFTGIDDPYEAPEDPEITLDTVRRSARRNAMLVLDYLIDERFVRVSRD